MDTRHGGLPVAAIILAVILLLAAGLPWLVGIAFPLQPSDLAATPTAYAIEKRVGGTATALWELSWSGPSVSARSDLSLYRCTGEAYKMNRVIPRGTTLPILGWGLDDAGVTWFLVKDEPVQGQEWIKAASDLNIKPPDYTTFYPKPIHCRL